MSFAPATTDREGVGGEMAEKCGCVIERFNGGIAMASYDRIVYCPLHEAAPELLEALKASAEFAHRRGSYCAGSFDYCTKRECIAARKVIKKAEVQG